MATASSGNGATQEKEESQSPSKKARTENTAIGNTATTSTDNAKISKEDEDSVIASISPSILESPPLAATAPTVSTKTRSTDLTSDTSDRELESNEKDDEDVAIAKVVPLPENPNTKFDEAVASSRTLLRKLTDVLDQPENENFCVQARRKEWKAELTNSLKQSAPDTIIGVLGNTGVGCVVVFVSV